MWPKKSIQGSFLRPVFECWKGQKLNFAVFWNEPAEASFHTRVSFLSWEQEKDFFWFQNESWFARLSLNEILIRTFEIFNEKFGIAANLKKKSSSRTKLLFLISSVRPISFLAKKNLLIYHLSQKDRASPE